MALDIGQRRRTRDGMLGPEHPHVATTLNNLGRLYYYQGKFAEAEPLFKRALAIREKALGPEHPQVAQSLKYLSRLYTDQGKYKAVAKYLRQSGLSGKAKPNESGCQPCPPKTSEVFCQSVFHVNLGFIEAV